jgi:predicted acyl esterase
MPAPRKGAGVASAALFAVLLTGLTAPPSLAASGTSSSSTTAPSTTASSTAAASSSTRFTDIPGADGVTLKGLVVTPATCAAGGCPLLVMPSSWGLNDLEYLAVAQQLADAGYVVVSYTPRGFGNSGGTIDVAGPEDVADSAKVIDWALAKTPADPDRIGMAGVSYGAGISLLSAAFDRRIKAVASLSGWADLVDSIFSGRTQHLEATALLGGSAYLTGRPSPEFQQVLDDFLSSRYDKEAEITAWGKVRSPATYVDRVNANGTAVMMANAWGDSLFSPNQLGSFYDRLTVPKRLELRPGDHVTAEGTGLLGLPNDVWTDTRRWLDHYLKGIAHGIDSEQPVELESRTGGGYEGYGSWASVPATTNRLALGGTQRIATGIDSGADGGVIFLSSLLDQLAQIPPIVSVPLLPRAVAAVWQSGTYAAEQRIRGTVRLHTTVTPSAAMGTFVAYVYDVNALGVGKLVTHAPYTFTGRTPGEPFGVDLDLFSTAYDVPAGHHLAVVVDTADPLYIQHNPSGATVTFSSPASDPSWLSVPLR